MFKCFENCANVYKSVHRRLRCSEQANTTWIILQGYCGYAALPSPAWGTYSTWAHYSCRSKGPCQKGATKEVKRFSIYLHYHQKGVHVVHKSSEIFLCLIFHLSSIHSYGENLVSSKYGRCKSNFCTHIWKDELGCIFWPWLIFERQAIAIREQRLNVKDVLATCEMYMLHATL